MSRGFVPVPRLAHELTIQTPQGNSLTAAQVLLLSVPKNPILAGKHHSGNLPEYTQMQDHT